MSAVLENPKHAMRERLLRATLDVLSTRSLEAITLREITAAAGANIAAVNYYFGSRDQLLADTIAHAFRPINRARLQALDAYEADLPTRGTDPVRVVEALIVPMLSQTRDRTGGRTAVRLMLQLRSVPSSRFHDVLAGEFDEVHRRFLAALRRALPEAGPEDIQFAYDFARGAAVQILGQMDTQARHRADWQAPNDDGVVVRHLVRFIVRGLGSGCGVGAIG